MKTKVAIVYGWGEGPGHSKKIRNALSQAGYEVVRDLGDADIVIAHSGGGFLLHEALNAKLILLVNLPWWPGKHPLLSLGGKLKYEFIHRKNGWKRKNIMHVYYTLFKSRYLYKMWNAWRKSALPSLDTPTFVYVRNELDTFAHPEDFLVLSQRMNWKIETLPGSHDDLWSNPGPYIKIMKKYYELLV